MLPILLLVSFLTQRLPKKKYFTIIPTLLNSFFILFFHVGVSMYAQEYLCPLFE